MGLVAYEVFKKDKHDEVHHTSQPLPVVEGLLKFEQVNFDYDEKTQVLHNLSFEAEPGKVVAWAVTLVWLRTDNMIWKVKGEAQFDEMKKGGRV